MEQTTFDNEEVTKHPTEQEALLLLERVDTISTKLALAIIQINEIMGGLIVRGVIEETLNEALDWATDVRLAYGLEEIG